MEAHENADAEEIIEMGTSMDTNINETENNEIEEKIVEVNEWTELDKIEAVQEVEEIEEVHEKIEDAHGEIEKVYEEIEEVPEPEKIVLKPGAQLAARREEMGMTQEQVADRLKMTLRKVRELEEDTFVDTHGVAITRGFIRAYSKVLHIDSDPLVAMFADASTQAIKYVPEQRREMAEPYVHSQPSYSDGRGRKKKSRKTVAYILFVIVLIAALVVGRNKGLLTFDFKKKTNTVKNGEQVVKPVASASDSNAPKEPGTALQEAQKNTTAAPAADGAQQATPAVPNAVPANANANTNANAAPLENALMVNFSAHTWIQVLRADSSVLFEYKGSPGDVQKIEIKEPVTLVVGDAASVQVEFRGSVITLQTNDRNAEARVDLK